MHKRGTKYCGVSHLSGVSRVARPRHLAVVAARPLLQLGETVLAGQRAVAAAAGAASRVLLYALETIGTQLLLPRILHEGLADHRHGSAAAPLPRCPQHPGAVSAVMLSDQQRGRPGGFSTFTSQPRLFEWTPSVQSEP